MSRGRKGKDARPARVWPTGTEFFSIIEAHPYHQHHQPVGRVDHKGAGEYVIAYDPQYPRCREERSRRARDADDGA